MENHRLKPHLNLWLLIILGISSTVGSGIYMVIGVVAKEYAGPSIFISFLVAGMIAFSNSLSFVDLSSKYSSSGGLYTYVLQCCGEKWAFLVGWTSVLGNIAAVSIGAQTFSSYCMTGLMNRTLPVAMESNYTYHETYKQITEIVDLPAALLVLILTFVLVFGTSITARFITVTSLISIASLIALSITGMTYGTFDNLTSEDHPYFAPKGIYGIIQGTSLCYFAYTGFVTVCFSSDEARDPKRTVPIAIGVVVIFVMVLYLAVSIAVLRIEPYWLLDTRAPLLTATQYGKLTWTKYIIIVGVSTGLIQVTLSCMYGLSRLVFCMGKDGLLFQYLRQVNGPNNTPVASLLTCGFICVVGSSLSNLWVLISFTTIVIFINSIFANLLVIKVSITGCGGQLQDSKRNCQNNEVIDVSMLVENIECPVVSTGNQLPAAKKCQESHKNKLIEKYVSHDTVISQTTSMEGKYMDLEGKLKEYQMTFFTISYLISLIFLALSVLLLFSKAPHITLKHLAAPFFCVVSVIYITINLYKMKREYTGEGIQMPLIPWLPTVNIFVNVLMLFMAANFRGFASYIFMTVLGITLYRLVINRYECGNSKDEVL